MLHSGITCFAELNEATLGAFSAKPSAQKEMAIKEWVESRTAAGSRSAVADELTKLVVEKPDIFDHAILLRRMGALVEPEFSMSVLHQIDNTDAPDLKSRLLQLLWESSPKNAGAISKCLVDKRFAENLEEMANKNPKLKESIANGAIPFRVCDIAYNVIQEIRTASNASALRLSRSQSIEARDGIMHQVTSATSEDKPDEAKAPRHTTIVPPPTQSPKQATEAKSTRSTPDEEPASSTPWSIIVVLIVATIGLLWLLLKGRK